MWRLCARLTGTTRLSGRTEHCAGLCVSLVWRMSQFCAAQRRGTPPQAMLPAKLSAVHRRLRGGVTLVSLGATTDLAAAERLAPGTLARYESVCLMGGVTKPLVFGGRIMDELNLSVDARATYEVLASTRSGAHLRIADAHDCLPLTFDAPEFLLRLARADMPGAGLLRRLCAPWFEKAHADWGIQGFVGWDVLAAVAAATPELVDFVPFHLALYERFFRAGLLFEVPPTDDVPSVDVELVRIRDGKILAEHVYRTWHRALEEHFG